MAEKRARASKQSEGRSRPRPTELAKKLKRITILAAALFVIVAILACIIVFGNGGIAKFTSRTIDFGLKNIGELATQAGYYTNINTITKPDRTIVGVSIPGTSSKAIMTYQGVIRAGLDFDKIAMNIDSVKKVVSLEMPAPRILSNEIDLDSCEVYDEQNSIFNKIDTMNFNDSLKVMKENAEIQAKENNILENAKANAEVLIKSMFDSAPHTNGYTLEFHWAEETEDEATD